MATWEPGGLDRPFTLLEETFLATVAVPRPPFLDVWRNVDHDGTPWIIVFLDFSCDGSIRDTLRLDFDGATAKGGWSHQFMNGDAYDRADEAGVDYRAPDGLLIAIDHEVQGAAAHVRSWFEQHYRTWSNGDRPRRWM
ncbi:MAG: hypothetical protein Q7V62_04025 [Actinomycetota bacterium]|nr:hypothetical protein [Actinomycetota bacterium]MDP2289874.1 hypothetical protein [Actinomycetota bacterium]